MIRFLTPRSFLLLAAILGLLTTLPVRAVDPAGSDLTATVRSLEANRIQGLLAGDPGPLAAGCTEDTRLITEGVPTVFGAANIAAYYHAFFARFAVVDYAREGQQSWDLGPRVARFGRFTERLRPKGTGPVRALHGKFLDLWQPGPGATWRLVATAWNYDAWLTDSDSLRFDGIPAVRTALQARAPLDNDVALELAGHSLLLQRAVIEHDADLWGRFYADDAVLLPNNAPIAAGHRPIAAFLAAHCRELPIFEQLDLRNDRVEAAGGYIYEFAGHTANWRNGASSGVSMGKNLRIWRREPDHMLKMILQISAYD